MKPRVPPLIGSLAVIVAGLSAYPAARAAERDPTPRTIVMSAYGPEWTAIKAEMKGTHEEVYADVTYIVGSLRGKDVVLFRSGVSLVNAAMTTQAAIDHFTIERIVFSGIAGGIDPDLSVGDVVVPERWTQYLESVFARETADGWFVPDWLGETKPNYGMIFPYPVEIAHPGVDEPEYRFWFDADPALLRLARTVAEDVTLRRCSSENECLESEPEIVIGGNGVTGPAFVDNGGVRDWLQSTYQAKVVDNESGAVAQVAYANKIPFVVFRSLSDLAGGDSGENTMKLLESFASDNSARVVLSFVESLP